MSKILISLSSDKKPDAINREDEKPGLIEKAEAAFQSESRGKGKGGAKSPRQQFFSELMKRLAGDAGNEVANAFMKDRKKFKGMMIKIVGDMASVEDE